MVGFYPMCHPVKGLGQSLRISRSNVFILTSCGRINLGKKLWWLPSKLNKKPREKHSVASPPRVFHSVFCFVCQWSHLSFFASVDPATLGEYKLLNSYLSSVYVWIWYMIYLCSSLGLLLGLEIILVRNLVNLSPAAAYPFCLDMPLQHSPNHI